MYTIYTRLLVINILITFLCHYINLSKQSIHNMKPCQPCTKAGLLCHVLFRNTWPLLYCCINISASNPHDRWLNSISASNQHFLEVFSIRVTCNDWWYCIKPSMYLWLWYLKFANDLYLRLRFFVLKFYHFIIILPKKNSFCFCFVYFVIKQWK